MKMNRKGFMMAEVVVVSAIVLSFLSVLYTSYNKIYSTYLKRISYYDVVTLYRLAYYRDILVENHKMPDILTTDAVKDIYGTGSSSNLFSLPPTELSDNVEDRVFIIRTASSSHKVTASALNSKSVNATFKEYINYLSTAVTIHSNYVMVMERCSMKNDTMNKDDCKYAYLEIYDGNE